MRTVMVEDGEDGEDDENSEDDTIWKVKVAYRV